MCNYRKCPYRLEDIYAKDSWQTYNACTLRDDGWDYALCNPNASYCEFKDNEEELTKVFEDKEKQEKIERVQNEIEDKEDEIRYLQERIVELREEIEYIKLGTNL